MIEAPSGDHIQISRRADRGAIRNEDLDFFALPEEVVLDIRPGDDNLPIYVLPGSSETLSLD